MWSHAPQSAFAKRSQNYQNLFNAERERRISCSNKTLLICVYALSGFIHRNQCIRCGLILTTGLLESETKMKLFGFGLAHTANMKSYWIVYSALLRAYLVHAGSWMRLCKRTDCSNETLESPCWRTAPGAVAPNSPGVPVELWMSNSESDDF